MQVQAFRKMEQNTFASTMCIGNLRSGVELLCHWTREGDVEARKRAGKFFRVILLFALGAGIGSLSVPYLGRSTIWLSCFLLLGSFCLMFCKEHEAPSDLS